MTAVLPGRCKGATAIHVGRTNDSRIYADGINMGWVGSSGGGGQMPQVASAQEVVMTVSGEIPTAWHRPGVDPGIRQREVRPLVSISTTC
jgi:hypothetical protein